MVKTCRREMVLIATSFEAIESLAPIGALTNGQSSLSGVDRKLMMGGLLPRPCAEAPALRAGAA
jgi:hypothetical protein